MPQATALGARMYQGTFFFMDSMSIIGVGLVRIPSYY